MTEAGLLWDPILRLSLLRTVISRGRPNLENRIISLTSGDALRSKDFSLAFSRLLSIKGSLLTTKMTYGDLESGILCYHRVLDKGFQNLSPHGDGNVR